MPVVEVTVRLEIGPNGEQRTGFAASTADPDLCFAALMAGIGALWGKSREAAAASVSPVVAPNGIPFRSRT